MDKSWAGALERWWELRKWRQLLAASFFAGTLLCWFLWCIKGAAGTCCTMGWGASVWRLPVMKQTRRARGGGGSSFAVHRRRASNLIQIQGTCSYGCNERAPRGKFSSLMQRRLFLVQEGRCSCGSVWKSTHLVKYEVLYVFRVLLRYLL